MGSDPDLDRWPSTEEHAIHWLRSRGGPEEQKLADQESVADLALVIRKFGLFDELTLECFPAVFRHAKSLRRARTDSRRIGALGADLAWENDHDQVWGPLRFRLVLVVAIIAAGWLMGAGWWQSLVLCATVPFLGRRTVIATCITGLAVAFGPATWWVCLIALIVLTAAVHAHGLYTLLGRAWTERGPFLGFLPVRMAGALALRRKLSAFATAVDVSGADHSDVAEAFIESLGAVPPPLAPVVDMCRAGVALQQGEFAAAVAAAGRARATAQPGPSGIAGWCSLRLAAILLASGRDDDAHAMLTEAEKHLGGRRARRWRMLTELQLIELDTNRPGSDLVGLLARIHRLRLAGQRRHLRDVLIRSETWLARLMLRYGASDHVRWTIDRFVGPADGRGEMTRTRDETAAGLLMRAAAHVDNPEASERVAADANAALALVDAARRPLAAVNAQVVLARLREREGRLREGAAHAVASLIVANRARYQLPSSRWRAQWSVRQVDAFATALRLAGSTGDSAFVAEVIELARGEVLPADVPAVEAGLLSILDLTAEQVMSADATEVSREEADAAFARVGFSPVARPPVARIRSARHSLGIEEPGLATFDLERELLATAGRCWYWSAVIVASCYHWAVRDPAGRWSHGSAELGPATLGGTALAELAAALPIAVEGETPEEVHGRVLAGPLGRSGRPSREYELLLAVGHAILPPVLRDGLMAERSADRKLVVSLPAALGHVSVGWLPLSSSSDLRVLEMASVVHLPAWAVVTRARSGRRRPLRTHWPMRLGLVNPGGSEDIVTMGTPPRVAEAVTTRPMTKTDVRLALESLSAGDEWLLYLAGHMVSAPDDSSRHGLGLAGDRFEGLLTLRDLVGVHPDGSSRYPVPARVLSVGCDTMGVVSSARQDGASANEWLGFGAALLLAGVDGVCCTAYTVFENKALLAVTNLLAEALVAAPDAAIAVAGVQRALLDRWRRTGRGLPVLWQSFVYIGQG
ncbi:CHAT domain-containing protein [Amycolatopsis sp. NPDC048633]|uniref:CHAT domain-containing protein n=1 Tax=Amycolatopsis sp. NPDC048633 TaxID=3157095 RepID=UPI0033D2F516